MRVCPKCGFKDPPEWKHVRYSYWIDSCSFDNFKILNPLIASQLTKPTAEVEDEHYVYRLCRNGDWVERKAKIDFVLDGWSDGTERYISPYQGDKNFRWTHNQTKLFEFSSHE